MVEEIKAPQDFSFKIYYVKEKVGENSIEGKILINPPKEYLEREDVEVVSERKITLHIVEVITVGKRIKTRRTIFGVVLEDGSYVSPTFHIVVKHGEDLRKKLYDEVVYYLKIRGVLDGRVYGGRVQSLGRILWEEQQP